MRAGDSPRVPVSAGAGGTLSIIYVVPNGMDSRSDEHLLTGSGRSTRTGPAGYPNTIEDPSTGASITFLEHGADEQGAYLLMDGVLPPGTDSGPARLHPRAEAHSEVLSGRAEVIVRGEPHTLLAGEALTIAPGAPHSIRNDGADSLVVRTTLRPPGEFEAAIRALYEAGAGRQPDLFAVAAVLSHYRADVRLAGLPWVIQRPLLRVFAGLATMLGRSPLS
ncbi:cupin domain-containing protein [Haloferax marisrubri]|uniref:Cupin domain-containing protein n=2 Tax=Haloferax marisrubri TaxID=1544719 RepID=A0A2P4NKN3_9EURY|nr:cupin domain-containing protein [Haloferax marisrubri]